MRKTGLVAAILIVAGLTAGQALGAQLFFTVGPVANAQTYPVVVSNPVITLDPTGNLAPQTAEVHLWAKGTPNVEKIVGIGMSILNDTPGVAVANVPFVYETPGMFLIDKWETGYTPGLADELVQGIVLPAVTTAGLDWTSMITLMGYDLDYNAASASFHVLSFTVTCILRNTTTEVYLTSTAAGGIVFATGKGMNPVWLGAGDEPVNTNIPGTKSALADMTIIQLPEPASLALLALGGLALIRRR